MMLGATQSSAEHVNSRRVKKMKKGEKKDKKTNRKRKERFAKNMPTATFLSSQSQRTGH
jgi:hypothetical protein